MKYFFQLSLAFLTVSLIAPGALGRTFKIPAIPQGSVVKSAASMASVQADACLDRASKEQSRACLENLKANISHQGQDCLRRVKSECQANQMTADSMAKCHETKAACEALVFSVVGQIDMMISQLGDGDVQEDNETCANPGEILPDGRFCLNGKSVAVCMASNGSGPVEIGKSDPGDSTKVCTSTGATTADWQSSGPAGECKTTMINGQCVPEENSPYATNEQTATNGEGGGSGGETSATASADPSAAGAPATGDQCREAAKKANICCSSPLSCVAGDKEKGGGIGDIIGGVGSIAGAIMGAGATDNEGIAKLCKFMSIASTTVGGINMAGAATCMVKKSSCKSTCNNAVQNYANRLRTECGADPESGAPSQGGACSTYYSMWQEAKEEIRTCNGYTEEAARQAMQGIEQGYASKVGDLCSNLASKANSNGLSSYAPKFGTDCSDPANASSPYCQTCSDPVAAANNPFCKPAGNPSNTGGGFTGDEGQSGAFGASNYESDDLMDDAAGQGVFGGGEIDPAQAAGIQGGGGGGVGGGDGSASLGSEEGGGDGGPGHNTKVLKGVSGGGGYVGPSGSRVNYGSTGGFSGYGSGSGNNKMKGLDLKQFLPGAKNDPRKRKIAGLMPGASEIGRKETNIFHTMSKKYKQMCRFKRMWDCPQAANFQKKLGPGL